MKHRLFKSRRRFFHRAAWTIAFLFVFLFAPPTLAQGSVAFENFTHNATIDSGVAGALTPGTPRIGLQFTASVSGPFQSVTLPLFHSSGQNAAEIALCRTDPVGGWPGQPLELFQTVVPAYGSQRLLSISSQTTPTINAGEQYWLTVAVQDDTSLVWFATYPYRTMLWYHESILPPGPELRELAALAFRITVIPEPAIAPLIALGTAALIARKRK